jgi:hypothetical protein
MALDTTTLSYPIIEVVGCGGFGQGLQLVDVLLGHPVPPFGLMHRVAPYEHGERRVGIVS